MKPHIIIIDDEAPIREMLSLYFRQKGFEVATAVTGQQATQLLRDRRFHLAILDVDLNEESGLDLLNHFKSKYSEMAVVMFGGTLDEELPKKALVAGANGFMRKTGRPVKYEPSLLVPWQHQRTSYLPRLVQGPNRRLPMIAQQLHCLVK